MEKKKIDKVIDYFICNISPFILLILGVYLGCLFGSFFTIGKEIFYPKIIGGVVGFIIFGIIARFAWSDTREVKTPPKKKVIRRKTSASIIRRSKR